jgi:hypothetical protein
MVARRNWETTRFIKPDLFITVGVLQCRILFHGREPHTDRGEKFLVVEWLGEECGCASIQRRGTDQRVVLSGKDNHSRGRRNLPEPRLHFETVHHRHPDVEHRNRRAMSPGILQKLFGIGKLLHIPTGRGKQTSYPLQNSGIVIQQADGSGGVKQSGSRIHRRLCARS